MRRGTPDPHRSRSSCRGVVKPTALHATFEPIAVIPCRLLRLCAHDETGWGFGGDSHQAFKAGLRLATIARESGGSPEALRIAFAEYSGPSNLFPSDQDLREAFTTRPAYQNIPRPRLCYILRELEFASRDEYSEVEGLRADLEIEHILPQTWYEHWPLPDGSNAPPDLYGLTDEQRALVERRQALIHVLGNLTLLTKPANIEVLNYAFDPEKKARLPRLHQVDAIFAIFGAFDRDKRLILKSRG